VKFPLEFDVLDLCTEELKAKIGPVNTKLKEFERDRAERRKVRKRTKMQAAESVSSPPGDVEMLDAGAPSSPVLLQAAVSAGHEPPAPSGLPLVDAKGKASAEKGGALEPESEYRARELAELQALIPEDLKADEGCSVSGLYELVGIVTHTGAAADSGHYMGFVKKSALHPVKVGGVVPVLATGGGPGPSSAAIDEDDEDWYKFDDEKVTLFPSDKLSSLDGGGKGL